MGARRHGGPRLPLRLEHASLPLVACRGAGDAPAASPPRRRDALHLGDSRVERLAPGLRPPTRWRQLDAAASAVGRATRHRSPRQGRIAGRPLLPLVGARPGAAAPRRRRAAGTAAALSQPAPHAGATASLYPAVRLWAHRRVARRGGGARGTGARGRARRDVARTCRDRRGGACSTRAQPAARAGVGRGSVLQRSARTSLSRQHAAAARVVARLGVRSPLHRRGRRQHRRHPRMLAHFVRRLAERHGGAPRAQPRPGRGDTHRRARVHDGDRVRDGLRHELRSAPSSRG